VARPFMAECQANCLGQNLRPGLCRATCSCVVDNLRQSDLWQKVLDNRVADEDRTRISRAAQQCLRRAP
jgi:uncharacterized membrane protein